MPNGAIATTAATIVAATVAATIRHDRGQNRYHGNRQANSDAGPTTGRHGSVADHASFSADDRQRHADSW